MQDFLKTYEGDSLEFDVNIAKDGTPVDCADAVIHLAISSISSVLISEMSPGANCSIDPSETGLIHVFIPSNTMSILFSGSFIIEVSIDFGDGVQKITLFQLPLVVF
jgi:hypothetical protein